jgi:HlyD family secretion protein
MKRDAESPLAAVQSHLDEAGRLVRTGRRLLLLGCLPLLAWLAWAPLSSAVVAPGVVKVDLNRRPVQHPEGGTVREVLVRVGEQVRAGAPMLVLGDVAVDADRQRISARVQAERAGLARLDAEQSMAPQLVFAADLQAEAARDPALNQLLLKERSLFNIKRQTLNSQVDLLRQQRDKILLEITGLKAQISAADVSLGLQGEELKTNRQLQRDGFISTTRVTQIEAQVADYGVKLAERQSERARAEQRLIDTDLRVKALENDYRQQASDQLKLALVRLGDMEQEQRKTDDAARRQVIVAPAAGEVMDLRFTAPGAVIAPREVVADIVPSEQALIVEALLRPEDINRVHLGQRADVRFTAFAYRSTKLAPGEVRYVAADRLVDRASGAAYFVVHIAMPAAALREAGDLKLLAGMPAEVYIEGEARSALQYLAEPLSLSLRRAGRER